MELRSYFRQEKHFHTLFWPSFFDVLPILGPLTASVLGMFVLFPILFVTARYVVVNLFN